MATAGWRQLVDGWPWFRGEGSYPIAAYSEFLPPPRLGRKPYGGPADDVLFTEDDPFGWHITEYEEAFELRPGLDQVAGQVLGPLVHLGSGRPAHGIARGKLENNPYWPPELARSVGKLDHERYVAFLPLALSRTQDDKGRFRWTVFGGSEQGPARAFWRSFYLAPRRERPAEEAQAFLRNLLHEVYDLPLEDLEDLAEAGFCILPQEEGDPPLSFWKEGPLPRWTAEYVLKKGQSLRGIKFLLTFRPFGKLPATVQRAYLEGRLHLLPFPGSLVFWGVSGYLKGLRGQLPFGPQAPLLNLLNRHEDWRQLRVPQSGWLHEPRPGSEDDHDRHGPIRNTFKRTHRWSKVHRYEDELSLTQKEDKLVHVLFSAMPEDIGLYGKPMARNVQLWSKEFDLLLDGPRATHEEMCQALETIKEGGLFGYRFQYPAMRVGRHEVYWHRPLVAYRSHKTGEPAVLPNAPLGYLTAYLADKPDPARPVELWPRLLERPPHLAALQLFQHQHRLHPFQTTLNVRKLLDSHHQLGQPLPRSFARRLLTCSKHESLESWLDELPDKASNREAGVNLTEQLRGLLEPEPAAEDPPRRGAPKPPPSLTYEETSRRSFEVNYWKYVALLAEGKYLTKNNADCVHDTATQKALCHHHRDLDVLGSYLLTYYTKVVAEAGMTDTALVGDIPFQWRTDFHFAWMGGWLNNQQGLGHERNLITIIPGRDRSRAIIMADHYDTAYMLDRYDPHYGGNGARLAASGADDNHSATVALMLGAPIFLELSKAGKLDCDIWLIHLTGEEFPADCLGARHIAEGLVEGSLRMRLTDGRFHELAQTQVQGLYVLDMIAHNNDHDRDVFQISPGSGPQALWLAYQAHVAAETWNRSAPLWNQRPARKGKGRGRRSPHGAVVPETAEHPILHGEVRPPYDPRSTLYNTDGQVFSDAGIPAVLFMENYDINRTGYHDTHDTMANIDLDYGAAVAAITIESVARAATEKPAM